VVSFTHRPLYPWEIAPVAIKRRFVGSGAGLYAVARRNNPYPGTGIELWSFNPWSSQCTD